MSILGLTAATFLILASLYIYATAVSVPASVSASAPVSAPVSETPSTCALPPEGLVNWWTGDNGSNDVQGQANGSLEGGARAGVAGLVQGALEFDGVDGRLTIAAGALPEIPPAGEFSLALWLNPSGRSTSGGPVIFQRERTYLGLDRGIIESKLGGQTTSAGVSVSAGQWRHVALTYRDRQLSLYVDGELSVTETRALEPQAGFATGIGYNSRSGKQRFAGRVDEVGFYARALDASEIMSIFNAASKGQCKLMASEPPAAALRIVVSDVGAAVEQTGELVTSLGGRMERAYLKTLGAGGAADLAFSAPAHQFRAAVDFLETQGEVTSRDLRQGNAPAGAAESDRQGPPAQVYVYYESTNLPGDDSVGGLTVALSVAAGAGASILLAGFALYLAYRAGYHRGRRGRSRVES